MHEHLYARIAQLMFEEYNLIAASYAIEPFHNADEVEKVLLENITEDDAARLEDDDLARMALSGFIAALMISGAENVMDDGGPDGSETTH